MTEAISGIEPMEDPYKVSKFHDAFYWQKRCESAEENMNRLRAENDKYRACLEAILTLRHALQQFDA